MRASAPAGATTNQQIQRAARAHLPRHQPGLLSESL
jgi:hypothetical protein